MDATLTPTNILIAMVRLEEVLPELAGQAAWAQIERHLLELLTNTPVDTLSEGQRRTLALEVLRALQPHEAAMRSLQREAATVAAQRAQIEQSLAEWNPALAPQALQASADTILQTLPPQNERYLYKGANDTFSIKLRNIRLLADPEKLIPVAGGVFQALSSIVAVAADPFAVIFGIVASLGTNLFSAATIRLDKDAASVFWGLVSTADTLQSATFSELLKATNQQRKRSGEEKLTEREARQALHQLETISAVRLLAGDRERWQIIERFQVQ